VPISRGFKLSCSVELAFSHQLKDCDPRILKVFLDG
jgi:hypothetical protein